MHLAALVDLGVPADWLREQLSRLPVTAEYTLTLDAADKMGINGTRARVTTVDTHDHRHHSTIVTMITNAGFESGVEQRALAIFQAIANAEGKIHNVPPEKVHFHEVGAVDSIVDIVAAALCIEYLAPDIVLSNPVEVGSGFVDCAHGRFPVPAPATQELLAGAPCTYGGVNGESTTPTGAAILAACVAEYQPRGIFTPHKVGYGIGHKDFAIPNVLRAAIGEYEPASTSQTTDAAEHFKLEANIDDMSPESFAPLLQALFDAGASDAYVTPIIMKKGRPAHCLVALSDGAHKDALANVMLNESSTIGLRILPFTKRVLPRTERLLETSLGTVRIKQVTQPNGRTRWKTEHDDVLSLAQANNTDYQTAKMRIDFEIATQLTQP